MLLVRKCVLELNVNRVSAVQTRSSSMVVLGISGGGKPQPQTYHPLKISLKGVSAIMCMVSCAGTFLKKLSMCGL